MNIQSIYPPNIGWLEIKLNDEEMKHLWDCCADHKGDAKPHLAGNINNSQDIIDKDNWFWDNVLIGCLSTYAKDFGNIGDKYPSSIPHPYYLRSFWVNYQRENEFNPRHNHVNAMYSFVIWMKIPTKYEEQKKLHIASGTNSGVISNFTFDYLDILGDTKSECYHMSPDMEGVMLFFPANLNHQVYPFYNCKDERISISGNISVDTTRKF